MENTTNNKPYFKVLKEEINKYLRGSQYNHKIHDGQIIPLERIKLLIYDIKDQIVKNGKLKEVGLKDFTINNEFLYTIRFSKFESYYTILETFIDERIAGEFLLIECHNYFFQITFGKDFCEAEAKKIEEEKKQKHEQENQEIETKLWSALY